MLNKKAEDGTHQQITLDGKQTMEFEVLWDTGEKIWKPLNVMKTDDPVTVAQVIKEDNTHWEWANRYIQRSFFDIVDRCD